MFSSIERLGTAVIQTFEEVGRMTQFLYRVVISIFGRPFSFSDLLKQIAFIGAKSMPIILLSGLFTGMVLALQFYDALARVGSSALMGSAVATSLIQELGPVMTALMLIARIGSATCAEIAIMRSEQQFDALTCMAINPYRYVMVPRLLAAIISVPLLTAIYNLVGISGGYIVGVLFKDLNGAAYMQTIIDAISWSDLRMSVVKSMLFAVIIIWISMGKGFFVHLEKGVSGAEAVSRVTTKAVVTSAITMLFVDYIASSFLI
ncbi:MAG: phospholipid/cholesterol/gamma-HCH transport system permease protein [Enterobacterales bacterium]|jgi:phospholipid/cholesterol/gamma-HCH transport system permease protein